MQLRIIVLEDDPSTRGLLTQVLEHCGHEVISAPEPLSCPIYADLDGRCNHLYACGDILLTDNRMPRMTGLEFIARQGERGCKGVVHNKAVFSGTWQQEELETAERLGCKVFNKPFQLSDILGWVVERGQTIAPNRRLDCLEQK